MSNDLPGNYDIDVNNIRNTKNNVRLLKNHLNELLGQQDNQYSSRRKKVKIWFSSIIDKLRKIKR